jgi:trk system potassium uptake protein TrkA|tara:strand:- start:42 stop:755 length:714 start_codon:yes stop_codon:yes gene_type:complete
MSSSKKSIAVLGMGQFGYQLAISLTQKNFEVLALDSDPEMIDEVKELVSEAIIIDTTDEKAMRSINIDTVDIAIVAIGSNVQSSLLSTALLQRLGLVDIHVRHINSLQENILKSIGIKHIISIEKEMGIQVSNTLSTDRVGRYISISERHSLMEIQVPEGFVGKSLKDLHVRSQFRVNIVGIKTRVPSVNDNGEVTYIIEMTDVPDPNYPLSKEDLLVIAGTDDNLRKFIQLGELNV